VIATGDLSPSGRAVLGHRVPTRICTLFVSSALEDGRYELEFSVGTRELCTSVIAGEARWGRR
jgi:hypothetical protein